MTDSLSQHCPNCEAQAAEIERLIGCLAKANTQAEHFEREWYLRGDRIEAQAAEIEKLRGAVEYYADRNNQCPNEGPWGVDSTDFGLVALKALKALGGKK